MCGASFSAAPGLRPLLIIGIDIAIDIRLSNSLGFALGLRLDSGTNSREGQSVPLPSISIFSIGLCQLAGLCAR